MACREWNDQWVARLYDELSPDEDRRVEEHLEGCSSCRETMDGLAGVRQVLSESAPAVPAAPRVVVLQPRGFRRPAWAFAAGLAAAAALFAVALIALPRPFAAGGAGDDVALLQTRLAALERAQAAPTAGISREELDAEFARWARRVEVGRAQDVEFLLNEITAAERRTGNTINYNNDAMLRVAMSGNKPGLRQH